MTGETKVLLCSCAKSFHPDQMAIERGTGASSRIHDQLSRGEIESVAAAIEAGGAVVIACSEETTRFRELAAELGAADRVIIVDIRDRAGWSDDRDTGPKMAALIADALIPTPAPPVLDISSAGVCLVYGEAEVAIPAAARLAPVLTVTAMLTSPEDVLIPFGAEMDVVAGRITRASGAIGSFSVEVDRFAERLPSGRIQAFSRPRDGGRSECDIIVDLSGGTPLFPAHHKRDGYLRADPRDPLAVERALFDAAQLIGSFEKPYYIRMEPSLCAHSRAQQEGCTRCLDVCPTSAISPAGDWVEIDPLVCAGCGACAAVCPTGAASADDPPVQHLFNRMRGMVEAYTKAGGKAPRLLVHDEHGAEMIRLSARYGRGLPADVIPLEISALNSFGHAEHLAALALGYAGSMVLLAPRTERDVNEYQIALARAIAGEAGTGRMVLLDVDDPDALSDLLYAERPEPLEVEPILTIGGRRDITRLAAMALHGGAAPEQPIPLPEGAPYGAVLVNTDACTLCLSCVGLCPTGALGDNPDRPELTFREVACVQCGICANICPENAIELLPQLDLGAAALAPRELNSEEPFCCIECGTAFGSKKTIDRITEKLAGVHSMFRNSDNVRLIQMCDDCRVRAQFRQDDNPFAYKERPRVRTSEDYIKARGLEEKEQ